VLVVQYLPHSSHGIERAATQNVIKDHLMSLTGGMVEDRALRHSHTEHLFQAERLGAKLNVCMRAMSMANLVLNRIWPLSVELNHIGFALQAELVRPEWSASYHPNTPTRPLLTGVNSLVSQMALDRE
jgi:hypothetical protein